MRHTSAVVPFMLLCVAAAPAAATVRLELVPDPAYVPVAQGTWQAVQVWVRTQQPVDGAGVYLDYDADAVELVDLIPGDALPVVLAFDVSQPGRIDYAAGTFGAPVSVDFVVATLWLRGRTVTTTDLTFAFETWPSARRTEVTVAGYVVLSGVDHGVLIGFVPTPTPTPTITPTRTPTPTVTPTPTPCRPGGLCAAAAVPAGYAAWVPGVGQLGPCATPPAGPAPPAVCWRAPPAATPVVAVHPVRYPVWVPGVGVLRRCQPGDPASTWACVVTPGPTPTPAAAVVPEGTAWQADPQGVVGVCDASAQALVCADTVE